MHIHRLRLHAYGHFEDKLLNFAEPGKLSLVYGPNEAGKSTALYALEAFLFGLMDKRVAVSYEKAWSKSKLKVTGWLSSSSEPARIFELQRGNSGISGRNKGDAEAWLPNKAQRGLFKELFALDGERLRAEAARVLSAGGDASDALGAALLGEQAAAQCGELEGQLEDLYKTRGRNQRINALRAELETLDKAIREQRLSSQDWLEQDRVAKEAEARAQSLERQREAVGDERAMLERDAKRLQADQAMAALTAQWHALQDQFPGLPALAPEQLSSLEALEREQTALGGGLQQRRSELEQLQRRSQALILDQTLWRGHEAAQEALGHGYDAAHRLLQSWKALQASRPATLPSAQELGHAGEPRATSEEQEPVLASQRLELEALTDKAANMAPLVDAPGTPEIPRLVGESGLGLAEVEALLRPELSLASRAERWREEQQNLRSDAQELAIEERAAARALEEAEIACQHLQDQGAGLDSAALTEARRQRDQLWAHVKRQPSHADLQTEFEAAVYQVDRLADNFARSERQAGAWQHAQTQQAAATLKLKAAEARAKSLAQQEAEIVQAIAEALGLVAADAKPRALEAVLALVDAVLASQADMRAWRQDQERWRSSQAQWQSLAGQAQALGYRHDPELPLDRGLRDWLKGRLEAARRSQARMEHAKVWRGFRDQEAVLAEQMAALLAQAEAHDLARLLGQGLESGDRLQLLAEAFDHERGQRQEQARLANDIARQTKAIEDAQARLTELNQRRLALVPADITDLAVLHKASSLQTGIATQDQHRRALGPCERWQDLDALMLQREDIEARYLELDSALQSARQTAGVESQALRTLQQRDGARDLRFERASKLEALRQAVQQYLDLGLQARVLRTGLNRFLEKQQDALIDRAGQAFAAVTAGAYPQLEQRRDENGKAQFWVIDERGDDKALEQLSEGTKDQLYLSLRLAALDQYGLSQLATPAGALPLICDDLLVQFDDARAARAMSLLADRRGRQQVIYFTHHKHMLDLARQHLPKDSYQAFDLSANDDRQ